MAAFALVGDYMIPVSLDEISTSSVGTDFTLRLHGEIKFHPGKAGQFSTWYLLKFVLLKAVFHSVKIFARADFLELKIPRGKL